MDATRVREMKDMVWGTQRLWSLGFCVGVIVFAIFFSIISWTSARNISVYRDTLSSSVPGAYSNHTIEFNANTDIPPGGYIRVRAGDGDFSIPVTTFDEDQVELYVAHPSAGYVLRQATTSAPDTTLDNVTITYGSTAEVAFTLNSTTGITAGDRIRILLGTHTTQSTTTDTGIQNPTATGTQPIYIEIGGGADYGEAKALVAIVDQVGVGPVDTRETIPPSRFNGAPSGEISGLVLSVELSLETDEFSRCRYSQTPGIAFFSMGNEFTNTGSIFHSLIITVVPDVSYTYYVRCIDDENNINSDDYEITFTVKPLPEGEPGGGSDDSDGGTDPGSGSGTTGAGGGSSNGDNDSSASGDGGSRGGGDGGGGVDYSNGPYESGDATVVVNGYAFPGSKIFVLVDGFVAEQGTAGANGSFSTTIDAIARGVYTFGVYAIDKAGTKSSTFSTTFSVAGARTSTLSNTHLMPTIVVTPNPVDPGAVVTFSGYAVPNSTVTIETQQDKSGASVKTLTASSDSSGKWSATQSTEGFAKDKWKVRAKSVQSEGGISTNFSQYMFYAVGDAVDLPSGNNSDLNRDGKVNLIDFSILLFHWNTSGGTSNPPADINRDGKVSLTDFSIMIFNWTG